MAIDNSIGAQSSADEAVSPPTPFWSNQWIEERHGESEDRADLVRLCNRTRSVTLGLETIIGLIEAQGIHVASGEARYLSELHLGALESMAKVSLDFLHEYAEDFSDRVVKRREDEARHGRN